MYRFITGFVALGLASCAAYFSVIGIASLMGANFTQVAVMAGFLEAGKLVCASAAYRFRKVAAGWVRALLVGFTVVMMLITSLGIFGFLSSSYQEAASQRDISQQRVENLESKRETFQSEVERLQEDRNRIISEQRELQETRAEQGWLSERQDQRLSQIPNELSETDSALTAARDSVLALENRITNLQSKQSAEAKLGPIIFVANTVGIPEDSAALYFILVLILVFDPMAVTLVVALSMATDVEETVTEEDIDSSGVYDQEEALKEDDDEEEAKDTDLEKVRKTLSARVPTEESEEAIEQAQEGDLNKYGSVEEMRDSILSPDDRIERMHDFASIADEASDAADLPDEDLNSQNKTEEEQVEEDPYYPERPPELDVSEAKVEETEDDDFEQWASGGGAETKPPREKPWKNAFKKPFN